MAKFLAEARAEFFHEALWYERRDRGLGRQFSAAIQASLRQIEAYPQAWPPLNVPGAADGIVRHLPVPPFPHSVVYVAEPNLTVIAIASGRRRPQYWVKRLRKVQ